MITLLCVIGAECPILSKLCEESPCPDGMECVEDPTDTKFKCICPEGKQEECSGMNTHISATHTLY